MKKIAKFEKVSYNQFKNDFMDSFPQYNEKEVEDIRVGGIGSSGRRDK